MTYILKAILRIALLSGLFICSGCSSWKSPEATSPARPVTFPDYAEVTIPVNIAPLNFMVQGAEYAQAVFWKCSESKARMA